MLNIFENVTVEKYTEKEISYQDIKEKPTLNGVEINGNKTSDDYGLTYVEDNSEKINVKYSLPVYDDTICTIEDVGDAVDDKTTIANAVCYPSCVDDDYTKGVSELYHYSCEMTPRTVFPYRLVNQATPRVLGYTVDFTFSESCCMELRMYTSTPFVMIVDGVQCTQRFYVDGNGYRLIKVTFSDGEIKKRHIQLWVRGYFGGVMTDGVVEKYECKRLHYIADGDSITEASNSNISTGFFNGYASVISRVLDMDLYNVGAGGSGYLVDGSNNVPNMVDKFDDYVGAYHPDILTVMGGLNDSGQDLDAVKAKIDVYWEKVSELAPRYVIMISPYSPHPTESIIANVKNIADYLRKVALKYNYPYIDVVNGYTYDAFGNIITQNPSGCIVTEENQCEFYAKYYAGETTDRTHPNNAANLYIGKYLANEIYKICKDDFGLIMD